MFLERSRSSNTPRDPITSFTLAHQSAHQTMSDVLRMSSERSTGERIQVRVHTTVDEYQHVGDGVLLDINRCRRGHFRVKGHPHVYHVTG